MIFVSFVVITAWTRCSVIRRFRGDFRDDFRGCFRGYFPSYGTPCTIQSAAGSRFR